MASHDILVLAGEIGSDSRTKKINNMINELDEMISQARDKNRSGILVRSGTLAERLNYSQSTICRNGYPQFFTRHYDSIEYKENKGITIQCEEFVEERKTQREKLAELNEEKSQ